MALAIYRDNPPAGQRIISDREARIVQYNNKLFSELVLMRNVFAGQWEEASALILPTSRNTFFYGSYNFPGVN
jgi:hypothetical protein